VNKMILRMPPAFYSQRSAQPAHSPSVAALGAFGFVSRVRM
jgi:hypothetical protein